MPLPPVVATVNKLPTASRWPLYLHTRARRTTRLAPLAAPVNKLHSKARRLELKLNRLVDSTFAGEYRSAFRGMGLEFEEVRAYQYGDDVRLIDWNVTARTGETYIKVYRESRERNIFVLLDVSASERFGPGEAQKLSVGAELSTVLALSALRNNDNFGLLTFSDHVEQVFAPNKGRRHVNHIVNQLLTLQPKGKGTHLAQALDHFARLQPRRSVVLVISDFLDKDYEQALIRLRGKHQVLLIRLFHPNEVLSTDIGIVPMTAAETGRRTWLNTGMAAYRERLRRNFYSLDERLSQLARRQGMSYLSLNTAEDYVPRVEAFFRSHNRRR